MLLRSVAGLGFSVLMAACSGSPTPTVQASAPASVTRVEMPTASAQTTIAGRPLVPRAAAIADALRIQNNIGARVTRVEARLATYSEWEEASASGHSFTTDPLTLVWVVGVEGSGLYCGMGGLLPMAPCRFAFSVAAANPPDETSAFGSNSQGWPAWFDRLADRDR